MTTDATLDLTALTTLLGHLGCHEPATRAVDAIEVWETREGYVVLSSQNDRFTGDLDWVMRRLADLESGSGSDAVFSVLRGDDEIDDEGQPTDLEEQADFAGDDDWRGYEIDACDGE